jgi:3-deoxy-D-manno-octulosonate 8-phosphate phosphatase (KDO 8-P phosphatase)
VTNVPCEAEEDPRLKQLIRSTKLAAFDFDGVFTDNTVYVFEDGREAVRCFRGDGMGLRKLEQVGIVPIIVSTETNPVVSARSKKMKIRCIQGCEDKRQALKNIVDELGISLKETAFLGNDINDLNCLTSVGLPMIVADAHPDVIPYATYTTKANGGRGAVREVCDLFARVLSPNAREETP